MYATKRKFHHLLNSLSANGSSTDLSSTSLSKDKPSLSTEVESQAKRRRVIEPYSGILTSERSAKRLRVPTAPALRVDEGQERDGMGGPPQLPNYAPWDRGQFLERLKTFKHVDRWSVKPSRVNEVQWAKRGWSCVGKERVGCVGGCGREVYIKLEEPDEKSVDEDDECEGRIKEVGGQ